MSILRRTAAVVVPLALVVGGVWYGVSRHHAKTDHSAGLCTTKVQGLTVVLSAEQARNASLISAIAVRRGMPAHAATIALATALQESKLYNLRGGDRDSLGLFQQRPSQGWGTRQEILDPVYSTNAFYDALDRVSGWETMPITVAAQRVQRSAYPSAYAAYEPDSRALASALTGYSPAAFSCHLNPSSGTPKPVAQQAATLREALAPAFGAVQIRVSEGSHLQIATSSRPEGWSMASYLLGRAPALGLSQVGYDGRAWGTGSNQGWKRGGSADSGSVVVG